MDVSEVYCNVVMNFDEGKILNKTLYKVLTKLCLYIPMPNLIKISYKFTTNVFSYFQIKLCDGIHKLRNTILRNFWPLPLHNSLMPLAPSVTLPPSYLWTTP